MMGYRIPTFLALLFLLLTASACSKPLRTDAPMTGFSFSHSGMHTGLIYTLSADRVGDAWQARASLLAGEQEHVMEMTGEEAEKLMAVVRRRELNRWNGFGKSDRRAQDGTGFSLTVRYEDGQVLSASGNNVFPGGYREAHEEILDFFGGLMERNGLMNPF